MRFYEFKEGITDTISQLDKIAGLTDFTSNSFPSFGSMSSTSGDPSKPGDTSSAPVNIKPSGANKVMVDQITKYLKSKGLDDIHILGMLVNIQAESSFNSGAYVIDSNKKPSGGLFQHNGDRFTKMVNATGNDWAKNWQGQIDYALSEPAGRAYLATKFSSPKEAVEWWTINFEAPKNKEMVASTRVGMLKNFT